ncbi:putative lipid-binding transport protein (Tim44 family) [Sphingomonas zeicaulis]
MMLYLEIILLAVIAGVLAVRLYSVLGKRTGHEQQVAKPAEERVGMGAPPRPTPEVQPESSSLADSIIEPPARAGVRAVVAAEPGFDVARFLDGAREAYRMVLEAFWKGDAKELGWLVSDDVGRSFTTAIAEREAAGLRLDNRLIAVERATIANAVVEGRTARITVRFDADIAAVTRDAEDHVVAGSLTDAVQTHDLWTFERVLRSADPNWTLVDTDEAA